MLIKMVLDGNLKKNFKLTVLKKIHNIAQFVIESHTTFLSIIKRALSLARDDVICS